MVSNDKASSQPRRGAALTVAGVAVAIVVCALTTAVIFRTDVAHAVLQIQLNSLGIENSRFRVAQIDTRSITISDFTSGESLLFDRLIVEFSLGDALRGQVERIDLTGLKVDLTQPGPWNRFKRGGTDNAAPSFDPRLLPKVDIRQARLRFVAPGGVMTVTGGASLQPETDDNLEIHGHASAFGPPGKVDAEFDGTVQAGVRGEVSAVGELRASSTDLAVESAVLNSLNVELPISVTATAAGATATVRQGARFEIGQLALGSEFGSGPVSGSITGHLTSALSSGRWLGGTADIAVDARNVRAANQTAARLTAALPMQIEVGPKFATIAFAREAHLALEGVRPSKDAPAMRVSGTISGRIGASWAAADGVRTSGYSIDHDLSIALAPLTIPGTTEFSAKLGAIETSGALAADGAYRGRLLIGTGRFAHGSRTISANGIGIGLTTGPQLAAPVARITVDALRGALPESSFDSFTVTAMLQPAGQSIAYQVEFGGFGISKLATLSGSYDFARRAGRAEVSIPDFALGGLPARIHQALSTIRNVAGRIGGEAKLAWENQQMTGGATLRLAGIGGETDDGMVEGISGTIVFDQLFPPSTAPEQRLRIEKIRAGAVLTDISVGFELAPSGVLKIGRAEATLADGKIVVTAPTIDFLAQQARATVTLDGVQLEQILGLLDLDNVHATGRIHGEVPIHLAGTTIAIDGGALMARGGGTLRFRSERTKEILKTGGRQVELMLQALEDFTYEQLRVDIDKSLTGDAKVILRTLGHNPAVLSGRKFQININLETNLDRLLEAASQWYRLSGEALRNIVGAGSRGGNR